MVAILSYGDILSLLRIEHQVSLILTCDFAIQPRLCSPQRSGPQVNFGMADEDNLKGQASLGEGAAMRPSPVRHDAHPSVLPPTPVNSGGLRERLMHWDQGSVVCCSVVSSCCKSLVHSTKGALQAPYYAVLRSVW